MNHKIKLLIVCTVPTERNGITNVMFNLLDGMDRGSFQIGYVAINEPDEFYRKKLNSMDVGMYVVPRKLSAPLQYIRNLAKVARGYDIMHVHGNSATMVLEMIAAKIAGVKVRAAHSHNTTCSMKIIDKLSRPLFHTLCNLRIACGIAAGRWLFGKRTCHVINNGIDTLKYKFDISQRISIRRSLNIDNCFVIGNVGNFVEAKNHSFLIEIFAEYHKKNKDSRLLLLGEGPLRGHIKNRIKELSIDDAVIFMGSVCNPQDYLNAMDIIVMPSIFEGLPLTIIEEQANGLSIVASDRITEEANISGNVHYMSLDYNAYYWAETIENIVLFVNRENNTISELAIKKLKEHHYDITETAANLKNLLSKEIYIRS